MKLRTLPLKVYGLCFPPSSEVYFSLLVILVVYCLHAQASLMHSLRTPSLMLGSTPNLSNVLCLYAASDLRAQAKMKVLRLTTVPTT